MNVEATDEEMERAPLNITLLFHVADATVRKIEFPPMVIDPKELMVFPLST